MIELRDVTVHQGHFSLRGVSFTVPAGRYGVLMGRTGAGKTTLLEVICGLRRPDAGTVFLNGRDVTRLKPGDRDLGYVPQDGALFPTLTVRQHLAFGPTLRRWPADRIHARVTELSSLLGITPLLDRLPHGLSGGERQRVALGRALAFGPPVLLLDEPLSALDTDTREQILDLLATVRHELHVTVLHVTHNPAEAARLSDHLFRLGADGVLREDRPGV